VSAAWQAKQKLARETGKPLGKLRPLWLDLTPDGYVLNPERAAIVRRIFTLSAQGYGSRSIAVTFNQEGIPAFTAGRKNFSGLWNYSGVRHIMESRTVLGEYQPHVFIEGVRTPAGEPIIGHFPPVVTEDEFYLANAAKDARHSGGVTKTTTNFNMLTGILCCYRCGGMMHLQGQRQRKYFKCANSNRGTCDSGIIGAPRAETVFKEILSKLDSLSLVQNNVGSLTKLLQINEGKTAELKSKLAEQEAAHSEFPSQSTAKLLAELERDLDLLGSDHQTLSQQLAADKVISKDDFFQKLDLVTYEGRVAANNLVKRLGVYVYALKRGRTDEVYCLSDTKTIPIALTPSVHHLMFVVVHKRDSIGIYAHQDKYREIEKIQRGSAGEPRHVGVAGTAMSNWFKK
jgi:hypothetical protein